MNKKANTKNKRKDKDKKKSKNNSKIKKEIKKETKREKNVKIKGNKGKYRKENIGICLKEIKNKRNKRVVSH